MLLHRIPLSKRQRAKPGAHQARARRQRLNGKLSRFARKRDGWSLTFPDRLKALAEKFYQQALVHPAFVGLTQIELRSSIENKLWSIANHYPLWFGSGRAVKAEATPAQLDALAKARAAKVVLNGDYTGTAAAL